MAKRIVYADNAGTTPMSATAIDAMVEIMSKHYGNPSGIYGIGQDAKKILEDARATVAAAFNAKPAEIYFTGGGSEADNTALKGIAEARASKGKHIITSAIEHHAITHTLDWLTKKGYEVTYIPVDEYGTVKVDELEKAIRPDTILISVMAANNEIGTIQPVAEIGRIAHEHGVLFHTDAVQAAGHMPIDVEAMHIDLMSIAAHKFRGPKGVGALYVRKGVRVPPLIHGGGQERNLRSGTENVAGIHSMACALKEAVDNMDANMSRVAAMRDRIIDALLKIPYSRLTGHPENRLPGTASFIFECVEGESIVLSLDMEGVCASSGSACSSASLDPSHVLLAIGLPHDVAHGSLRLSIGEDNTDADVDHIIEVVPRVIQHLRDMSPLWEDRLEGRY